MSAFSSISLPYSSPFTCPLESFSEMALRVLFCRGCNVWVATIIPGGGKMKKEEEEEKSNIRGKCVPRVYTASPLCIFWSATIPFYELSDEFSDSDQSWALLCRQQTHQWTHLRCVENDWRVAPPSSSTLAHTNAEPLSEATTPL